jgi:mannose-1-phosphate guanylyltransferase
MAGGQGTRLWPYSKSHKPKQFLSLNEKTFFTMALDRAFAVTNDNSRIIIAANTKYSELVENECGEIDSAGQQRIVFIQEPLEKNTAAVIAMAAVFCKRTSKKKQLTTLVLTSDHIIEPEDVFTSQALSLLEHISVQSLALIGIKPNRPETGFGYMKIDVGAHPVKKIASFHEKPNKETAIKYLK